MTELKRMASMPSLRSLQLKRRLSFDINVRQWPTKAKDWFMEGYRASADFDKRLGSMVRFPFSSRHPVVALSHFRITKSGGEKLMLSLLSKRNGLDILASTHGSDCGQSRAERFRSILTLLSRNGWNHHDYIPSTSPSRPALSQSFVSFFCFPTLPPSSFPPGSPNSVVHKINVSFKLPSLCLLFTV